jgi:hypothetical protein
MRPALPNIKTSIAWEFELHIETDIMVIQLIRSEERVLAVLVLIEEES